MNKAKAFQILGLDPSASDEDIGKKFRKLAAKKHPDVNKSPNAEQEYKQLSEAYEFLKSNKDDILSGGFSNLQDIFSHLGGININSFSPFTNVQSVRSWNVPPASAAINISFSESVLGCKKKAGIRRCVYCTYCNGNGTISSNEKCTVCNGIGTIEKHGGTASQFVSIRVPCNYCNRSGKKQINCDRCSSKGYNYSDAELTVQIPGGVKNDNIIRLGNAGHQRGRMFSQDEALLYIKVKDDPDMKLIDNDVISIIEISLIEALKGVNKKVRTVLGEVTIHIPERSKNKHQITLGGYGVNRTGNHIFILNVNYPKDIDSLIQFLEENKKK